MSAVGYSESANACESAAKTGLVAAMSPGRKQKIAKGQMNNSIYNIYIYVLV